MRAVLRGALLLGWLAACGGGSGAGSMRADDAGLPADLPDDFQGCPDGIDSLAPGLEARGERLTATVLAAMPEEAERYLNDWTVELRALDGSAAADAEVIRGETFMPVHGHDGRVQPKMTALPEPGRFQVDRLNFTMRGAWQVRLWLQSGSQSDYAVFDVCVAK